MKVGLQSAKGAAPGESEEGLFDVDIGLGRGLKVAQTEFLCELLTLLLRDDL
jgi:hypothetical protein